MVSVFDATLIELVEINVCVAMMRKFRCVDIGHRIAVTINCRGFHFGTSRKLHRKKRSIIDLSLCEGSGKEESNCKNNETQFKKEPYIHGFLLASCLSLSDGEGGDLPRCRLGVSVVAIAHYLLRASATEEG